MIQALVISNLLSWLVILVLAAMLFALARQIGVLHERIRPVGALALGQALQPGDAAPSFQLPALNGELVRIGGPAADGRATLLFFLADSCPVCKELLPALKAIGGQESRWLRLVLASDGTAEAHRALIAAHGLQRFAYLLSAELGMAYRIGKLPYGVLIDPAGRVAAHGLINSREHIESLFAAYGNPDEQKLAG